MKALASQSAVFFALVLASPALSRSTGLVIGWGCGCGGGPCAQFCGSPEFGGPFTEFSASNTHVAAIGQGRRVVCWSPSGSCGVPTDLGPVVSVGAANGITVAVQESGAVRCWGSNNSGGCASIPDPGPIGAVQVACGLNTGILRLADGTVVGGNAPAAASPSRFIGAGDEHWLSIKTDGQLVAWGRNDSGQTIVPTNLGPVTHATGGGSHTCAVTANGSVRCWGYNNYGQCNVPANLPAARKVGAGREHTVALLVDGTVRGWGHNSWGEAGNPGVTNVSHVDCNWYSSFALIGEPCPGDVYRNGQVDGADVGVLLAEWGPAGPGTTADINGDGNVDGADLGTLLAGWGACP